MSDDNNGVMDWVVPVMVLYIVLLVLSLVFFFLWTPIKMIIWNAKHGEFERNNSPDDRPYAFTLKRAILSPYVDDLAKGAGAISLSLIILIGNLIKPEYGLWESPGTIIMCCVPAIVGLPFFIRGLYQELRMLLNYNRWVETHKEVFVAGW